MKNKKGFTLIELLAVIIILGVIMLIAIPSVTRLINDSRKNAYVDTAKQIVKGAIPLVNGGEIEVYDTDTTYYLPASCIPVENNLSSPYGDFDKAYVIVGYTGEGYVYYWASVDKAHQGIEIKEYNKLNKNDVKSNIETIDTTIGIGGRSKITVLDSENCRSFGEIIDADNSIGDDGTVSEIIKPDTFYAILKTEADNNGLARKYTGNHKDSYSGTGTFDIYHWYAENSSQGNQISQKNNVIFGGFCWKMFRTTDTGGVKLIYTGPSNNGKCNTPSSTGIGYSKYSNNLTTPDAGGYMTQSEVYNNRVYFKNIDYYDQTLTDIIYSNSYVKNNDGTYSLVNPISISRSSWGSNYRNAQGKYVCKKVYNNICSSVEHVSTARSDALFYVSTRDTYLYSNTFSYSNGTYHLTGDIIEFWDTYDPSELSKINNHHYTCRNMTGECTDLTYVYGIRGGTRVYHFKIVNGIPMDQIYQKFLDGDNINVRDSIAKQKIDLWYEQNLINYTSKLEDTVFCNNRAYDSLYGWNPNGGDVSKLTTFNGNDLNKDLSCSRDTDRFSLSNPKAKLKYPIALITTPEFMLMNNNEARSGSGTTWTLTPRALYGEYVPNFLLYSYGGYSESNTINNYELRPVVSLKKGTKYISGGEGTVTNPYVVE